MHYNLSFTSHTHIYKFHTIVVFVISFLWSTNPSLTYAQISTQQCKRTAFVGHKEIPIDASTVNKGQGLKFYLDKNIESQNLLNEYQLKSRPQMTEIILGSLGTSLAVLGLAKSGPFNEDSKNSKQKRLLVFSGLFTLLVNFILTKTNHIQNEDLLESAVKKYNRDQKTKIYFSPRIPYGTDKKTFFDTLKH